MSWMRATHAAGRLAAGLLLAATAVPPASAQGPAAEASFATVEVVPVPARETLFAVTFADPAHGWAVGQYGAILATTDGGATWHRQKSGVETENVSEDGFEPALRSVSFADARHGYAVGYPGLILTTRDGGATWEVRKPPPVESIPGEGPGRVDDELRIEWSFRSVKATGPQSASVLGDGGTILRTNDGGATWTWHGNRQFGHLAAVSFPDAQHGYAVPSVLPKAEPYLALATKDGGVTWEKRDPPTYQGDDVATTGFTAVSFVDSRRGFIAGAGGRILATTDGGAHWAVQRRDTTESFQGLAVAGSRGLAAGFTDFTDGRKASLATTGDGGETWISRLVPGLLFWGAAFASRTTAFAVGCADEQNVNLEPCHQALIARVTFSDRTASAGGGGDGGGGLPIMVLIGSAVVVAGLSAALVARRRRSGWH